MMEGRTVVGIDGLAFRYRDGEFHLRIPRLELVRGESTAFIGPSGSGKTTLLNLIAGVALPTAGHIVADGMEVTRLPEARRRDFRITRIGLIFQEFELLDYLSVLDNILLPYRINSALSLTPEVRARAQDLARQVGIADKLARYPRRLSQGERQRVAVCRAVLPDPALILADEPTGNLDPVNAGRVLDILFEHTRRSGATLLAVTHDHDLLGRFERVVDFKQFSGGQVEAGGGGATAERLMQ
jgi:putative ABC transport system ATP-binding protein